jgi:2-oxo-3-hexenedioate decarboxylase
MSGWRRVRAISSELMSKLGTGEQIVPFSRRYADFGLAEAYEVVGEVRRLRELRGDSPVGRKIGFTNKAAWSSMGIAAPIWNYVFDRTVQDGSRGTSEFPLSALSQPRIEPELVLHLAATPTRQMGDEKLLACVDWIAPAFEVVWSIFPDWVFGAADAAAAFGLHGGLVLGAKRSVSAGQSSLPVELSSFSVELDCDGVARRGSARDILGGPLAVLRSVMDEIAGFPAGEPLRQGELISTGTLTVAMPATRGMTCTVRFAGVDLQPLRIRLRD